MKFGNDLSIFFNFNQQRIYQQVLLQDLEYALDCKVEQELWNYGFKNYIGILQNMVKDKKVYFFFLDYFFLICDVGDD